MYHHDPRSRRLAFETMENRLPLDAAACAEPIMDGADATADAPVLCLEADVTSEPVAILISEPMPADLEADAGNVVVEADAALVDAALETVAPELEAALNETAALAEPIRKRDEVVEREREFDLTPGAILEMSSELSVDPPVPDVLATLPAEPVGASVELELANPNSPVTMTVQLTATPPPSGGSGHEFAFGFIATSSESP